ncbi:MAG TPA: DNA polymerase I [Acidimicrobiales bacterium]|nr:DNA polymerase I [Acidimicrobiales bacterium]
MADDGPLFLLDGNSLVFRAFFALPIDLATRAGLVTNAVYGFTSMLVNLLRDHSPSGIAVAFDRPEPTFRDAVVEDYKGNRPETPDLLIPQFGLVRQVLEALGLATLEVAGYEADDILATLATAARDAGRKVVVVTGDRDAFQLVEDPYVTVMYTRKGISDTVIYDEAGIEERYGVPASSYGILAALRGDSSDNLAGVPGVGEKTAAKLVTAYGSLDEIFGHLDEQTPKLRANLTEFEDRVRRNAKVIPLVRDVPLALGIEELGIGGWQTEEVKRVFGELEMPTLWSRLAPLMGGDDSPLPRVAAGAGNAGFDPAAVTVESPATAGEVAGALKVLGAAAVISLAPLWSGDPGRSALAGLALAGGAGSAAGGAGSAAGAGADLSALWISAELVKEPEVLAGLAGLLGPGGPGVVAHGAKELMRVLLPAGIDLVGLVMDSAVAAYLLDPSSGRYRLADVVDAQLGIALDEAVLARAAGQLDLDDGGGGEGAAEEIGLTMGRQAVALGAVLAPLRDALERAGLTRLHDEVERPLVRVLARMEVAGIAVDGKELRRISDGFAAECSRLEAEIQKEAGEQFNVNSTPQLRTVLYEKLGLTPGRKTKTGFSTDAQTLERIRDQHPVVGTLLRYREVEKLRSTYGESLLGELGPDGRIHASFAQTVARTGRLSSDRPNLHNIPVRSEEGRQLRRAFVPRQGWRFLVADYDQIELRVIAHLSGDPGLIGAFAAGQDIHRTTAARVFGVPAEEVTGAQRNRAKMVSYGLAYGMEAFGLGQRLGIETAEAQGILDAYFAAFPSVRAHMEQTVAEARAKGYTETLFGRRRALPDLHSPNRGLRMAAERQAMNAGIQGLAADLFKVALVRLDAALEDRGLESRLVLQVHDEVLVEAPKAEEKEIGTLVPEVLSAVAEVVGLAVPLEVSSAWGSSWADAKG